MDGGGDRTTQNVFLEIADILWIEVTHVKYSPVVMYSASTTRHWNGGFTQFHHVSVNCELCRVRERILRKTQPQRTNAYGLTFARWEGGQSVRAPSGGAAFQRLRTLCSMARLPNTRYNRQSHNVVDRAERTRYIRCTVCVYRSYVWPNALFAWLSSNLLKFRTK